MKYILRTNNIYSKSKNVKYDRNCDRCSNHYIGWGKNFCSNKCARQNPPKGEMSPFWKGDNISQRTGRGRASKIFKLRPCELCGKKRTDRCHLSGDTRNNSISNIVFLCRKHHFQIDIPIHLRIYNRPRTSDEQVQRRKSLYAILKQKRREKGLPLGNLPPIVFPL